MDVIIHPGLNFNGGLVKPKLKLYIDWYYISQKTMDIFTYL